MKSNSVSVLKVLVSGRTTAICSSLLVFGLLNCSGGDVDPGTKTGGNKGTGGAATSGGSTSNGGSNTTGGAKTTGGSNAGGAPNTGGSPAKGGSTTTAGSGGSSSGGATVIVGANGGSPVVVGTGGVTTSGGSVALCSPQPVSKGGIACPAGICKVGTLGGYNFKYTDSDGGKPGKSTICMMPDSLCAAGTTGAQDPPAYATWGAGIGFNLSPTSSGVSSVPVQLTGTGISVTFSSLPSPGGARVQMSVGGVDYCASVTTPTATLLWADFNTKCWAPTSGVALTAAPLTPQIQFQANAGAVAAPFDFCITALTIQ